MVGRMILNHAIGVRVLDLEQTDRCGFDSHLYNECRDIRK